MEKLTGLIEKYRAAKGVNSEIAAEFEETIIRRYLAPYKLPRWINELAIESMELRDQTEWIIAELEGRP